MLEDDMTNDDKKQFCLSLLVRTLSLHRHCDTGFPFFGEIQSMTICNGQVFKTLKMTVKNIRKLLTRMHKLSHTDVHLAVIFSSHHNSRSWL